MDKKMHDKGLEVRKAVLGEAYVNNALKNVDDFNRPFQEMLNEASSELPDYPLEIYAEEDREGLAFGEVEPLIAAE